MIIGLRAQHMRIDQLCGSIPPWSHLAQCLRVDVRGKRVTHARLQLACLRVSTSSHARMPAETRLRRSGDNGDSWLSHLVHTSTRTLS